MDLETIVPFTQQYLQTAIGGCEALGFVRKRY
jgi:hypothetical protein